MALTQEELDELNQIIAHRSTMTKADNAALRKIARDPIKRRKAFKIVPGAALSREAARLAQFYEQAWPEQRAALDTLMSLFVGSTGAPS